MPKVTHRLRFQAQAIFHTEEISWENQADFVAGNPGCNDDEGDEEADGDLYGAKVVLRTLSIPSATLERLGKLNIEVSKAYRRAWTLRR